MEAPKCESNASSSNLRCTGSIFWCLAVSWRALGPGLVGYTKRGIIKIIVSGILHTLYTIRWAIVHCQPHTQSSNSVPASIDRRLPWHRLFHSLLVPSGSLSQDILSYGKSPPVHDMQYSYRVFAKLSTDFQSRISRHPKRTPLAVFRHGPRLCQRS